MEYLNVYDNNKNKLDKKIVRGDKLSNDEHILVAVIFIKNKDNKYLIQKTSLEKSGLYSTTGGHVLYNEDSKTSIIREVKEETNLDVEIDANKRYTMEYVTDKGKLKQVVLFIAKCIGGEIKAQECEVNDIKWLDFDEAIETITYDNTRELFKEILKDRKI